MQIRLHIILQLHLACTVPTPNIFAQALVELESGYIMQQDFSSRVFVKDKISIF